MRKLLCLFFVVFWVLPARSQNSWVMGDSSRFNDYYGLLQVEAGGAYRSNAVNNQLTLKLVRGGMLDPQNISDIEENLNEMNRAGGDLFGNVTFFALTDSVFARPDLGWMLQVGHRQNSWSNFSRDAFRLAFQGNSKFRGAHADLSGTTFKSIAYQKFGLGLFDKKTFSSFRLNFINGQQFSEASIKDADLYTSLLGDSLHLRYQGSWVQSDTSLTGFGKGNGVGVSADLSWNIPLNDDNGVLNISIEDLGLIFWGKNTLHREADTTFSYIGFDLQEVLDNGNDYSFPVLEDTLGYQSYKRRTEQWLPTTVNVSLKRRNNRNDFFEMGMAVRVQEAFIPELYGGYYYFTNNSTLLSANFRYGGYGNLRIGASLEKWLNNEWFIGIRTDDVPGFILNNMKGRSLYLQFSRMIKTNDQKRS